MGHWQLSFFNNSKPHESMSNSCINLINQFGIYWLPELIWHHQDFDDFKGQDFQRWQFEKSQSGSNDLLISSYSITNSSDLTSSTLLTRVIVEDFDFHLNSLDLFFKNGKILLVDECTTEANYSLTSSFI